MRFKDFQTQRPEAGTRILAFSPVYKAGDPMRFRIVQVLPVGMDEVRSYVTMDELEHYAVDRKFTVYWRDGRTSLLTGPTIDEAFTRAGYGAGALASVDVYSEGEEQAFKWDAKAREWMRASVAAG